MDKYKKVLPYLVVFTLFFVATVIISISAISMKGDMDTRSDASNDKRNNVGTAVNTPSNDNSFIGDLEVIAYDDFDNNKAETVYELYQENGEKLNIIPVGDLNENLVSGMKVKVKGAKVGNNVSFNAQNTSDSESGISIIQGSEDVLGAPSRDRAIRILVVMLKRPDIIPSTSKDQVYSAFFEKAPIGMSLNEYYKDNTYGKYGVAGDVTGWVDTTLERCLNIPETIDAAVNAGFNPSGYDVIVRYSSYSCSGYNAWAYIGKIKTSGATTSGSYNIGAMAIPSSSFSSASWYVFAGHELGHSYFKLEHSNARVCNNSPLYYSGTTCSSQEYGNGLDLMGGGVGHFSPAMKAYAGLFSRGNVVTVAQSGRYYLEPYETASSGPKAIVINDGYSLTLNARSSTPLWLHYRQPIGADAILTRNEPFDGVIGTTGGIKGSPGTAIWDLYSPYGSVSNGFTLLSDQLLTNPQTGTKVQVVSVTPEKLTVDITFKQ